MEKSREMGWKIKICLIGQGGVGKTSLVRRFVLNEFDEEYLYTLGTNVYKKEMSLVPRDCRKTKVTMMVWDIVGEKDLRHLFTSSYFRKAEGGLAVCDCTRTQTLRDLPDWINSMHQVCGLVPITILANKIDLKDQMNIDEHDISTIAKEYDAPYILTSAKTGENVERSFARLAERIVERTSSKRKLNVER